MDRKHSRILPESKENLMAVEVGDRITLDEYTSIFASVAPEIFGKYETAKLLLKYTRPFHGWECDAAEMDLKMLGEYATRISKIALVDPPENVLPKWRAFKPVIGQIKCFKQDEYDAALEWIRE